MRPIFGYGLYLSYGGLTMAVMRSHSICAFPSIPILPSIPTSLTLALAAKKRLYIERLHLA
jgi:hypothetical protein